MSDVSAISAPGSIGCGGVAPNSIFGFTGKSSGPVHDEPRHECSRSKYGGCLSVKWLRDMQPEMLG
jgi:hypothetical protein